MDKEFYQIFATAVTILSGTFAIMHYLKKDIRTLSNKIEALGVKIEDVKDRVIYIEAGIDFSKKNTSTCTKPVKKRKPREKKKIQITMKDRF